MEHQARTAQRLQKEKKKATVEVPPEPPIISSLDPMYDDSIYDDKLLFVPGELRDPVPEEQQRELFEWLLEEKRKLKPKDNVEKKKIDEEKAILKRFLRAESIPKL